MPIFSYQAISETGTSLSGTLEAVSPEAARAILESRGLIPLKLMETSGMDSGGKSSGFLGGRGKVKTPDLILFTKQFRTLIKAGVPMLTLLQVLEAQTQNAKLKRICAAMARDIREGATLFDAFKKHPDTFSKLYCSMVRAGETSGALPEILERVVYIIEHEHKVRSDIKSALQYPITVVVALIIAFFVLLTFVVPKFAAVFKTANIELPLPTRICIGLYDFLASYWHLLLGGMIACLVMLILYLKTEQGKFAKDSFLLRLPIMGSLFVKAAMSRFASIFAILQASGVPVLDSLGVLSGTIGNTAIARQFEQIRIRVEEGRGISGPLSSAKYFTPLVVNMVAVGEESGNLDEMLREVSRHYDDEVAYSVSRLSEALNPILIVGLAVVVCFFALAIFLPMWDMTKLVR